MGVLPAFELHRPSTIAEAVDLVSWDDLPYVGGTELLLAMKAGLLNPRSLIDLKHIPELATISTDDGWLDIGATVTHQEATGSSVVADAVPELPMVLSRVGNPRVRWSGTLAGNLCFAEPKSDVIPFLIALDGEISLASKSGSRRLPVRDFIVGPYFTSRTQDELLTQIHVPVDADRVGTYLKYQVMERPTVGVAAVRTRSGGAPTTRVVVGAAGELPVAHDVAGAEPDPQEFVDAITEQLEPVGDLTGSPDYKRHVTGVFVRRALDQLERL